MPTIAIRPPPYTVIGAQPHTSKPIFDVIQASCGGHKAHPTRLQRILVVDVPAEVQRERLTRRDGIDVPLAEKMIAAQATREQRLAIADDVLVNTGSLEDLQRHVAALDTRYRTLAEFM